MDTFMDKLAQRLTAQEIIKANTAADTEEMNKLKGQIAEYHQCLEQLRKLLDEETVKLQNSQVSGENINRLVNEGIAKIQAVQQDTKGMETLQRQLSQQIDALEKLVDEKLSGMEQQAGEKLEALEQQAGEKLGTLGQQVDGKLSVLERVDERLGTLERQVGETLGQDDKQLTERFTTLEENVHKECVKVYRNVQAVVVEESSKQSEAVTGTVAAVGKMGGKTSAILGISIVALLASLGSVVLQVLQIAGVL